MSSSSSSSNNNATPTSSGSAGSTRRRGRENEAKLASLNSLTNRNVDWLSSTRLWFAYVVAIVIFRIGCFAYFPKTLVSPETEWTLTNVVHGLISFIGLHWNRGSPFWGDQGEHIEDTVWEQIDNGVPWTATRKFLLIIPVLLFIVSAHFTNYNPIHLAINLAVLAILLVAKLPELHGVRILGINAARLEE